MPACRKCSIVDGRYAILRKELFFSKKVTNCGARPGKGCVSKTTPLLGDIPRLMSGQADQKPAPFAAGVNPVRNSSRCDSKPSGALNPVRDLSLNGINPALRGGTRNFSKIYPHPYILAFPIAINQPFKVYHLALTPRLLLCL